MVVNGPVLWLTIAGMAIISYLLRVSFLLLHERIGFPPLLTRALRYVPYAVLAALVVPVVAGSGEKVLAPELPRVLAATAGALIAWRTRSVLLTLTLGMATLWLTQLLL